MNTVRGFTLTELLITLAIAAILLSFGAPSMQTAVRNARLVSATNELVGALQLARSEAVKQSMNVSVCARASNISCGNDWTEGWLVFQDNGATAGSIDTGENIISVSGELPENIDLANTAITAGASGSANPRTFIRFSPRGSSNWRGGGSFIACDGRGDAAARAFNIVMSGDVRTARKAPNGDKYDAFGNTVSCPAP